MSFTSIFSAHEPDHYSCYGFDSQTQIDYFQMLEESRRRQHHSRRAEPPARPADSLHFKPQKTICKDDSRYASKKKKRGRGRSWWKSASSVLFFWKRRKPSAAAAAASASAAAADSGRGRSYQYPRPAASLPIYATESASDATWAAWAPCRTSRPGSAALAAADVGPAAGLAYVSLRDFNLAEGGSRLAPLAAAPPPAPIYLVT